MKEQTAMPELPEPDHWYYCCGESRQTDGYTADQMREYALAAIQALSQQAEPVGIAEIGDKLSASFIRFTDAGRALPPGKYDLFTAPPAQAQQQEMAMRLLSAVQIVCAQSGTDVAEMVNWLDEDSGLVKLMLTAPRGVLFSKDDDRAAKEKANG